MERGRKKTDNSVVCLLTAIGTSIFLCAIGILIITHMTLEGRVGETATAAWVPIMILVITILGGQVLFKMGKKIPMSIPLFGLALAAIMIIGGFLIDGELKYLLPNMGAIGAGTVISLAVALKRKTGKIKKKRQYR